MMKRWWDQTSKLPRLKDVAMVLNAIFQPGKKQFCKTVSNKYVSMISLLAHTVAQPTKRRFLPKNLSQLLFSWLNLGSFDHELTNIAKIWLSTSIFYVKNHRNLPGVFVHWRISIKEHICCYWHFLIKSIFKAVYY